MISSRNWLGIESIFTSTLIREFFGDMAVHIMALWTKIHAIFRDRRRTQSIAPKHLQIDAMLRSGFSRKRARWRSRVLDFFPAFTDKG